MKGTISERLNDLIHHFYRGNQAKFCLATGLNTSKVSAWCTGKFDPKYESLAQILIAHPTMSIRWFMLGDGNIVDENAIPNNDTALLKAQIEELKLQVAELKSDKERLWSLTLNKQS